MTQQKTLAIDFDGTLCQYQTFGDGKITNPPNEGAVKIMQRLKDEGYRLVIFTVRLHPKWGEESNRQQEIELAQWCECHDVPYDEITNSKPEAMVYIDDRAVRFTNWRDVGNYFLT